MSAGALRAVPPIKAAFVLEQTLGHVAHGRNLERSLEEEEGIDATVIRIAPRGRPRRLPGLRNWSVEASWQARSAIEARLRQGRLDALFIHTQVTSLLSVGAMRRVPTVLSLDATPHNFDAEGAAYGHRTGPAPVEALKRRVNQRAFGAARALVTWCRWAADSLEQDYGVPESKIRVIHPGVDLRLFRPRDVAGSPERLRLLFVGGDFVRKGGDDLFGALRGLGHRFELDLVTTGEVALPTGLAGRVHHGLRPQSPELVELYRSADLFVLPSRGDCFPQVVAEALACGLPVIASPVGAIGEIITDGVNGFLVPPASPGELSGALRRLVEDPSLRLRMGAEGLALARERHDARRNARQIMELMRELASADQS